MCATCNPKIKNAIKLKNAAQATATRGVNTLVETTVAIEFAASWKPFIKSNAKAKKIITISSVIIFLSTCCGGIRNYVFLSMNF